MRRSADLSDDEVFGSAPVELSDQQVFGQRELTDDEVFGATGGKRPRTLGERFADNLEDAVHRNPLAATAREAFSNPASLALPGSRGLTDAPTLFDIPVVGPAALGAMGVAGLIGRQLGVKPAPILDAAAERERRERYDARSQADPFYEAPGGVPGKLAAGAVTLGGQLAGAATDPQNLISPGNTVLRRATAAAAINAVGDAQTQVADIRSGVQDRYSPAQTAAAAGLGAAISGVADGVSALTRRAGVGSARELTDREVFGDEAPTLDLGDAEASTGARPTQGLSDAEVFGGAPENTRPLAQVIQEEAVRQGADPRVALRIAELESGLNPKAVNPKSSAAGLYQFTDATWAELGGGDKLDPALSAQRGVALLQRNRKALAQRLGREPEGWEVYLAHQQGAAGAGALLQNPDAPAIEALQGAGLSAKRARQAVVTNGGRADMTAGEFAALWRDKFGRTVNASPEAMPPMLRQTAEAPEATAASVARSSEPDPLLAALEAEGRAQPEIPEGRSAKNLDNLSKYPAALERSEARLADLGERALRGEVDTAEAAALGRELGPVVDWSDFHLSPRERQIWREERRFTPRRVVEIGKTLARSDALAPRLRPLAPPTDAVPSRAQRTLAMLPPRSPLQLDHVARAAPTERPPPPPRAAAQTLAEITRSRSAAARPELPLLPPNMARVLPEQSRRAAVDLSAYEDAIKGTRSPAASQLGNVIGARPSAARAVGEGSPDYAKQTVSQLAERLRRSLGITQRQGRLTLKGGAVGEFDPRSGTIRTRAAKHAIDTLAHEAGHKLQHMRTPAIAAAVQRHGPELDGLAYAGANPAHTREEGFAEFVKAYLLNPAEAQRRAPNFYADFEAAIAHDRPAIAQDFRAIQKAYSDLLEADALDVAAASVAYTGRPGGIARARDAIKEMGPGRLILNVADEVYRGIWDQKHPFNVWMREVQRLAKQNTGRRLNVEAAQNPYVLARVADHAFAIGQSDILHGITPYRGVDPEGPSLPEIYRTAFGAREPTPDEDARFAAYLISRRMRHEWDRYERGELENPPDKVEHDKAFHERVVQDAERLNPAWAKAAEMATDWNRRHWKLWFEAGFISQATYEAGIRDHPDYVPLQRDMSDRQAPGGGGGRARGVGQFAGGADAFVGSQRDIIHPLTSMARRAFEARAAIARNEVVRSMWEAAHRAGDGFGFLLEEIPAKQFEKIRVDALQALDAAAKALGLSERDRSTFQVFQTAEMEGAIQAELFRQVEFSPRRDEAVVFMWKGGQKTPLLLPDGKLGRDLFNSIAGLTKDTRALWEEVAAAGATALRVGVTGMPEFALKTGMRDQLAAAILTDVGYVPYIDAARGLASEASRDRLAKRYQAAGGLKGGVNVAALKRPFPRNDVEAARQLQQFRRRGLRVTDWQDWKRGGAQLLHLADIGDTATRIGVFRKAVERAKARGLSDYDAVVEARHLSADFFDPSRHGGWPAVMQVARTVPFFNSGLQGPDVLVRTVRHAFSRPETLQDKAKFRRAWWALSALSATAVLGATLVMSHIDDPEFQDINDQVRATHWPLFKWRGDWVLYPKSFELGMPSNLVERAIGWLHDRDPRVLERIRKDLLNTSVPTRDAPVLAVPFQAAANRDRTGRPIVPEHLKGKVEPHLQVSAWTSQTAKLMAGNAVPPALVEHFITGFFGGAGRDFLRLGDAGIGALRGDPKMSGRAPDNYLTRGFVRRTARGSDSEENFWKLAGAEGSFEKAANSFNVMVRDGKVEQARRYLARLTPEQRTYVTAHALFGGELAKLEPIGRARAAMGVISELRQENRKGVLVGADGKIIDLSEQQRRLVDDALDDLALAEARNAQIRAGVSGWAQRELTERQEPADFLERIDPRVSRAVTLRMLENGVYPARVADRVWQRVRHMSENASDSMVDALIMQKRTRSTDAQMRTLRQLVADKAR